MSFPRKSTHSSALQIAGAIIATSLAASGVSHAAIQTFHWTSPQSGSWFEPSNWSPAAIPANEFDTAIIAGSLPVAIDVGSADAIIGTLQLTNPAAQLLLKSGRTMSIGFGLLLDGTFTIGESSPTDYTILRLGTQNNADVVGTGRLTLKGTASDPSRTRVSVQFGKMSTWSQGVLIEGVGSLVGDHRILGTAIANDPSGGALEFRASKVDGFNSGKLVADGAILRLFQSYAMDATLETRNGGWIELSAPSNSGYISLYKTTVRGNVRCILNTSGISQTDFGGNLEILAGASASVDVSSLPLNAHIIVRSNNGPGNSTLTFASGNPLGSGSITLNAESSESQVRLYVDKAVLGGARTVHGQGDVYGGFTLDGTIVADRATGPALRFLEGTIEGPGTLEARAGRIVLGSGNVLRNIRLLASDGGVISLFKIGTTGYASAWTNVIADLPFEIPSLTGLSLNGSVLNGSLNIPGGSLQLQNASSTINGDIFLSTQAGYTGRISLGSGVSLLGSGKIVLNPGSISGNTSTIPATREIRGVGNLGGELTILGPIFADGPAGGALSMDGKFRGSGTNTIEVGSGELFLSRPAGVSGLVSVAAFKVHALPGALPVRIGNGPVSSGSDSRIDLDSMDFDAQTIISHNRVTLTSSIFRRQVEIKLGVFCEIFGGSRFDSDLILTPSDADAMPNVQLRAPLAAPLSRVLFANRLPGKSAADLSISYDGVLTARLEGTGSLSPRGPFSGSIAPSDNSTSGPAGVLFVKNTLLTFTPDFVYEADVLSTQLYDRIDAPFGVVANGTLKITVSDSFYPPPSFNFHLIRGSATGAFTTVLGPPGYNTTITYNVAGVLARFEKLCAADLNNDGRVDDEDFALFCIGYDLFACADPAMPPSCPADMNRDGRVDDADFITFAAAYNELICS